MLWNLLVQPHFQKFHVSLEALCPLSCILSCYLSERLAFFEELRRSSIWILRVSQLLSIRGSGLNSSIDLIDGVSPCEATVQQIVKFFLYLHKELLYFQLPSTFLPSKGRSINTLGAGWQDLFIFLLFIYFFTLFRYFINLFYSFHCLSFPFLKGCSWRKGTLCIFCVPIHIN